MKKNKFAPQLILLSCILLGAIACETDYSTLESDVINNENATNFNIISEKYDIIAYTKKLGPVQTNGLGLNSLGIYDDTYGRTTASFVSQMTTAAFDPKFGEEVAIDSVVLTLPYFASAIEVEEDGNIVYRVDSVIKRKPIKLRIFESNYFIRDFDPNGDFNESQAYFSNKSASPTEIISEGVLEGEELIILEAPQTSYLGNNKIAISDQGFALEAVNAEDVVEVSQRVSPGIRLKLDPTFWQNKIIDQEGTAVLSNQNNFLDYFRGLYFKVEPVDNEGSFLILNVGGQSSNIMIYYTRLNPSASDDESPTEQATFELRFGPNRINFMDNDFTTQIPGDDVVDDVNGDSRLYLKGGEGAVANIKLFNGEDIDDNPDVNIFEEFKSAFVEVDEEGKFKKSKRLVNEANLVFYVDQDMVQDGEPNRIYLYDIANKSPLNDYYLDGNIGSLPSFSIINHLGPLQRVNGEPNGDGIKYKLKITEHINNLLLRDSTNVSLGLAVSLNVNLEDFSAQRKVQDPNLSNFTTPTSSIISPRGTILHGNNTGDDSKKVYLEIFYTEPN